jgi:HlyD family secretion protein
MKNLIIIVLIAGLLVGGYFAYDAYHQRQGSQSTLDGLVTAEVEIGTLTATIGATGKVRANQSAILTWETSGSVGEVNVAMGEMVTKGQVLAYLEETSLPQSVILAQADLVSAQKSLDDLLNSQLQSAQALLSVEEAEQALEDALNPELAQAQALQAIADAEKAVEDAERELRYELSTASQSDIDAAEAQVVLMKDALDRAEDKYEPYANKPEDNLVRANLQSQLSEAQQNYDAAVRNLNAMLSTGDDIDIAVAEADLDTAQARLVEAQREYEQIKDGASPGEIALLESQLEDAQREWERLKDGPDPDDIDAAEARVAAAEATLAQVEITAPFDGVVTMVESIPGDQVNPGTIAFQVDDLSRLLVDVEISEVDVNQVVVGQSVEMTFDAILSEVYHGEVVEVALVGRDNQGVVNFAVTVEFSDADEAVKPGMTSAVSIVSTQISEALLVPNKSVRVDDGEKVVYVLSGDSTETSIEPVPITLGASSDTNSQVTAGDLQVGDQIVLNPSSLTSAQSEGFSPGQGPGASIFRGEQ